MQTFVPEYSFNEIAAVLDPRRLFKQGVETKQVYLALTVPGYGWQSHPAVRMWEGCCQSLLLYGSVMVDYAVDVYGYRSDVLQPWYHSFDLESFSDAPLPVWWGDGRVHFSHRASLFRKDPFWYPQYAYEAELFAEYFWPDVRHLTPD
jgi:hypothetical protein